MLLWISVVWFQLSVGVDFPVFQNVTTKLPHAESLWLSSVRDFLRTINGSFQLNPTYVPEKPRDGDTFIMDHIIESTWFSNREIRVLNWCRLYLQAVFISDLSNGRGTHLDQQMYKGMIGHSKSSITTQHQFIQERPSPRGWTLWRKACLLWSTEHGKLRQPLGQWQRHTSPHRRVWPAHFVNGHLYVRVDGAETEYREWTQEEGKAHYTVAGETIHASQRPPA